MKKGPLLLKVTYGNELIKMSMTTDIDMVGACIFQDWVV